MRKNEGKPRIGKALLMPEALSALSSVLEWGEKKYSPAEEKGWMEYQPNEVVDSLMRHLLAWKNGEKLDPETELPHLNHMLFNAAILVELIAYYSSEDSCELTRPLNLPDD